ncbi:unnamed protein product [Prunus armeniaca]|uniref:Uncharacterized protein n=1 Tax=Prunus armeniaca TaxID=36596 RepID=A0A6J5YE69_PRUAR|nr:unnamed protein product [Prunus armeniaca]
MVEIEDSIASRIPFIFTKTLDPQTTPANDLFPGNIIHFSPEPNRVLILRAEVETDVDPGQPNSQKEGNLKRHSTDGLFQRGSNQKPMALIKKLRKGVCKAISF